MIVKMGFPEPLEGPDCGECGSPPTSYRKSFWTREGEIAAYICLFCLHEYGEDGKKTRDLPYEQEFFGESKADWHLSGWRYDKEERKFVRRKPDQSKRARNVAQRLRDDG